MGGLDDRVIKTSPSWEHMKKLVQHIVIERPLHATDTMESISSLVGTGAIVPPRVATMYQDHRPKPTRAVRPDANANTVWAQRAGEQIVPPKPVKKPIEEDEEPEIEEEQEDKGEMPDMVEEHHILNKFGEGLAPEEAFRVAASIKRLLDKEPLARARFWGKIIGLKRNYYIVETKIDESRVPEPDQDKEEEEEPDGKPPETILQGLATYKARSAPKVLAEEAKGLNELTYYVALSDDLSIWARLPDVLPDHIVGARAINKLFTGDLDSTIECQPPFPGTERHLLRAQIARIACGCTICPKDIFTTEGAVEEDEEDEDGNKIVKPFQVKPYDEVPPLNPQEMPDSEDPESVAPVKAWFYGYKNDELLEVANWTHIAPSLLREGRATRFHAEEEPADDEEDDTAPEEGAGADGVERINPFLSDLSHDAPLRHHGHSRKEIPCWAFRKAFSNPCESSRVYLARSLLWPGAMCYAVTETDVPGAQYQNFYCGYGTKATGSLYAPTLPPRTCAEFPTMGVKLMLDATYDDELEFEPTPPAPVVQKDEEEEEEEQ